MQVRLEGKLSNYETSLIDLKGVYKLVLLLPKAGQFRARLAEVFLFFSSCVFFSSYKDGDRSSSGSLEATTRSSQR